MSLIGSGLGGRIASGIVTGGASEYLNPDNYKKLPIVGGLLSGPAKVDTSAITNEQAYAKQNAQNFGNERSDVKAGNGVQVNTQYIDPLRQQQQGAIGMLTNAATGAVPSAAELQAKRQMQTGLAQQYGLAAALKGRSPGAALNTAANGAATLQGNVIAQGAAQRAQEQSDARNQLVNALSGVRGQEQQLGSTNANLNLDQQKMLLAAQLQNQGYSADMAKAIVDAKAKEAAASNSFTGSLLQTGAALAPLALA